MPIRSLGYIHLDVTDLAEWEVFAGEFLGLMPTPAPVDDSRYYRIDHFPSRLATHLAGTPGLRALGFEVLDRGELAELADALRAEGVAVIEGDDALCTQRQVTGLISFRDPGGNPIEAFYGPVLTHVRLDTPLVSGFVTGAQGFGHAIVAVEDVSAAYDFYTRVLGFWERNNMRIGDGELFFLACNERHHTLGIMPMPGPGRLVHVMVEAQTLDDVGLAIDRAERLGVPMQQTLGRHTNDHMVSFYVYSPERYAVELGWGGLRIPQHGPTYAITQGAFWGHKFTPPPEAATG
ncbi:MAG TPA: VOC family protein [Ilumatobacter sp.]|nr:VOC family protein [Ilumatobacter sp.]